jgi:hypothetical protein
MDVIRLTHVLEYLRPYGDADLSEVRFLKEKHVCTGLPNAATNAEWEIVVYDCLVVWQFEEIKLASHL